MKDFPSFEEEPNEAIFRCLPRPWNKSWKNCSKWTLSHQCGWKSTALLQQKDSAHHSGKPNLKPPPRKINAIFDSQLWLLELPFFLHWKIGLSTHTESRCDARRFYRCFKKRLVVFRFTVPVENPDIGIPKSASCKGESSMFALPIPDSRFAVANPRWGFDICLNPRAPSSMLDGGLNVAVSPFELIAIKKKFCLRSNPQIGIHFLVAIASRHPQHWQWGRRGSVCGWPLWGPCKERWPYGVLKGCACACHASMLKMAVLGSQALCLPRFNLYDGRTEFSSAAPATLQPLRWPYGVLKCCARHANKWNL